nr:universal stress protein [Clostridium sp. BJN0001]
MNKVLIPIDGTERSLHSFNFVRKIFDKDNVEITIMYVKELVVINGAVIEDEVNIAKIKGQEILKSARNMIKDYNVKTFMTFGYASDEILKKTKEEKYDIIVMTKSNKKGIIRMIGSVTSSVVKKAQCVVMVVPQ